MQRAVIVDGSERYIYLAYTLFRHEFICRARPARAGRTGGVGRGRGHPAGPSGGTRGKLSSPPVKLAATEFGLPILQPESCRAPEFLDVIRALAPELIVVAAYGQFFPDAVLAVSRFGAVNLHGSLLPKYRGAAPIQRAIWAGEERSGVCLMWMVRQMDAGDVIACVDEPIRAEDTAGTLSERLAQQAATLLLHWLPALALGTAPHIAQDPAAVTFAPAITKEERAIDWTQPAAAIARQIRALAPTPAATTLWRGQPLKIFFAKSDSASPTGQRGVPGEVVEHNPKSGLLVATGMGILHVLSLQPAGKRVMSDGDFLRGYHIAIGERFAA